MPLGGPLWSAEQLDLLDLPIPGREINGATEPTAALSR